MLTGRNRSRRRPAVGPAEGPVRGPAGAWPARSSGAARAGCPPCAGEGPGAPLPANLGHARRPAAIQAAVRSEAFASAGSRRRTSGPCSRSAPIRPAWPRASGRPPRRGPTAWLQYGCATRFWPSADWVCSEVVASARRPRRKCSSSWDASASPWRSNGPRSGRQPRRSTRARRCLPSATTRGPAEVRGRARGCPSAAAAEEGRSLPAGAQSEPPPPGPRARRPPQRRQRSSRLRSVPRRRRRQGRRDPRAGRSKTPPARRKNTRALSRASEARRLRRAAWPRVLGARMPIGSAGSSGRTTPRPRRSRWSRRRGGRRASRSGRCGDRELCRGGGGRQPTRPMPSASPGGRHKDETVGTGRPCRAALPSEPFDMSKRLLVRDQRGERERLLVGR